MNILIWPQLKEETERVHGQEKEEREKHKKQKQVSWGCKLVTARVHAGLRAVAWQAGNQRQS